MKKENFLLLTDFDEKLSPETIEPNIIINVNNISTIYENQFGHCVVVMNHPDYEDEKNYEKNYPRRIVVKEDFKKMKELLGLI